MWSSHTSPSFCEKRSRGEIQNWLIRDEDLLDDIKHERKVMDGIHAYLTAHFHPLQQWYYGHFHESWHGKIEGVKYNMLDIMELKQIDVRYFYFARFGGYNIQVSVM